MQIKENIKAPRHGEFPAQMASYAENVSIWWRHHVETKLAVEGDLLWKFSTLNSMWPSDAIWRRKI